MHTEKSGDLNEAKIHYQKSTDIDQNFADGYFALAKISCEPSEYDQAVRNFETALEIDSKNSDYHFYFAELLAQGKSIEKDGTAIDKSDPDRAIYHYQQAIELDVNSFRAHHRISQIFYDKKDFCQAYDHLQASIELNSNFADSHYQLAVLLMDDEAQPILAKFIDKGKNKVSSKGVKNKIVKSPTK